MLQITKQGNSIVVEGLNHYFYPYNGTLEVPCNSVITVVDEGDIVLFRSAANYDVLFSAKIDEITINGQSVTKDNVGEVFGALSNTSSGGGGGLTPEQEEKLNNAVQISDYNADKASQTTIDEAQNTEINKLKGDIEGKQDIIQDLNAIREGADLGKTAIQEETDPVWTAEKGNYYTKTEVNTSLESKANKSEIPTVPTNVSAFTNDAGYLTEHQSLNDYYTKTEVNASLEAKADKTEIPSLNGYATEQWVGEQGYLTEHQPLKTINGETIVGEGNIEITSGEETDPVWTAEKVNYYTKTEVNTSLESKADKTEIPTVPTNVSAFTNDAGYLTEHQSLDNYYTKSEVDTSLESKADKTEIPTVPTNVSAFTNDAGYLTQHQTLKTINGETIVGDGNIEITSGGSDVYSVIITDFTFNSYVKFYATKNSVPLGNAKLNITAIGTNDNNTSRVEKSFTLYTKDDGYVETPKLSLTYYHFIIEMYYNDNLVYKTTLGNFYNIQRELRSGTNIKTINGESILGSGDIVISGGGEETDPVWTAEKVNYYTKTEVNSSLESKANKSEIPSLDNYYTKSEIDGIVGNVNNALSEIING